MFSKYNDVMYKGDYKHPIYITFPKTGNSLTITGEGGNRALYVSDKYGGMNLWVNTHIYDGKYTAYIAPGLGVTIFGKPSPILVRKVYNILISNMSRFDCFMYYTEDKLDKLFKELYDSCKSGSINW